MKLYIIFIILFILSACTQEPYPAPICRVAKSQLEHLKNLAPNSRAACVVRINNRLLVVQRDKQLFDLAYSTNASALSAPYDTMQSEAASTQCLAHYAMYQQSGFNVEVGPLLTVQKDGSYLYACDMQAGYDGSESFIPAPPWQPNGVKQLVFIHPFDIELDNWQHPDELSAVRDAFVAAREIPPIHHINTSD